MVSAKTKDKLESWKRSISNNWKLYKRSTIGLVGLGIIIMFFLMAFLTYPIEYVDGLDGEQDFLKDPVRWTAPTKDIVDLKYSENSYTILSPETSEGTVTPVAGVGEYAYRHEHQRYNERGARTVFVPTEEGVLYFVKTGTSEVRYAMNLHNGSITTKPIGVNLDPLFYENPKPTTENVWIFTGTEDGYLFGIKEVWTNAEDTIADPVFLYREEKSILLDGSPILPYIYFDDNNTWTNCNDDLLYVGTQNGSFYALSMNRNSPETLMDIVWEVHVDDTFVNGPVILTGEDDVTNTQKMMAAGSLDGTLYQFKVGEADPLWTNETGVPITTTPLISDKNERVIIVTKDDAGFGIIQAYNLSDGKLLNQTQRLTDTTDGVLYDPYIVQGSREIFIGAREGANLTGYGIMWSVRSDMSVKWKYQTTAPVVSRPFFFKRDANTYFGCTDGRLYSLRSDDTDIGVAIFWQVRLPPDENLPGSIPSTPVVIDPTAPLSNDYLSPAVFTVTVTEDANGNPQTRVYSVSTAGTYLAPLPPTWAISLSKDYQDDFGFPASGNYYLLGTDHEGKDIFSQLMYGSRVALLVGFSAAFFSITIGTIIGLISGYFGGSVDNLLMRMCDVVLTLPFLPLVIILASVLGPSVWNIVLAIAAVGWPGVARTIRAETLSLKERPFIDSARITGASAFRIMFRHIAPNVMPLAFLFAMFSISGAILTEASLSFIGLGDPTTMSWGLMLYFITHTGKTLTAWWWLAPPGIAITLVSLGFYLIGRAFDEIVNPRLRER